MVSLGTKNHKGEIGGGTLIYALIFNHNIQKLKTLSFGDIRTQT
jgi:hypothetical protein